MVNPSDTTVPYTACSKDLSAWLSRKINPSRKEKHKIAGRRKGAARKPSGSWTMIQNEVCSPLLPLKECY